MHNRAVMPTDLQCHVVTDEPYALVRFVGVLTPPAAEAARTVLLNCLADRTEPVAVDVARLRFTEPTGLSVFADVLRQTADWPVEPPVFLGDQTDSAAWARAGIVVAESRQALSGRTADPATRQIHVALEPVVGAARRARELVTEGCGRWDLPELTGSGCIAITELVNNVVAHAYTPMAVRLAFRSGALHLGVRDHCLHQPTFGGPVPPTSAGGRGLLLVDTVARRWGSSLLADGKLVWAVLHPDDEPLD